MRRLNKKGFTLVEIMIVVAIIALLAAIAIPNLLRARLNANETAAIAAMQTISAAAISYRSVNSAYPNNLQRLGTEDPEYIDDVLALGTNIRGYDFTLVGLANSFTATAEPNNPTVTGNRRFFVDTSGVIRFNATGTADASDLPI